MSLFTLTPRLLPLGTARAAVTIASRPVASATAARRPSLVGAAGAATGEAEDTVGVGDTAGVVGAAAEGRAGTAIGE